MGGGTLRYVVDILGVTVIPGSPIAYWLSKHYLSLFGEKTLGDYADARIGLVSGDNERFLRRWSEIDITRAFFTATDLIHAVSTGKKWFPLQKGGGKRYWYGNLEYVINYERDGYELKFCNSTEDGRVRSHNYNGEKAFKSGITWNSIGTEEIICRFSNKGFIYDAGGPLCTINNEIYSLYYLGLLTSVVASEIYKFINPTINFTPGTLLSLPVKLPFDDQEEFVKEHVRNCIIESKIDWDSYEISWDFKTHPLV